MFGKLTKIVVVAGLIVSALTSNALAIGPGALARTTGKVVRNAFLVEGNRVIPPFAHMVFCNARPEECTEPKRTRWGRAPIYLTALRKKELQDTNTSVNRAIRPMNDDPSFMGGDNWSLAPLAGDCEDYALTKRHALIAQGWPARTLRLAITYTSFGEGHLVLVVKTSGGDMVLDNRIDTLRKWNKSGLKWRMIQASFNPREWLTL